MELRDHIDGGLVSTRRLGVSRSLLLIAVVLTGARLLAGAAVHLTEDEAYYRLWAQHLQLGYYDHPPMIAWWIRLGQMVAGDTSLGVRLLPILATGITTWLVGDLARRLDAGPGAAVRAALWYNATFTIGLGGFLAIPDAPTCFFWTVTLWCLGRRHAGGGGGWWLAAGLAAGLACLSKYSGLFLAPGVLLWLSLTPEGRAELRRPWPWAAVGIAVLAFAPNIAWNATHQWQTFDKQFGRSAAHGLHLGHLPEFVLTQFLLLNPIIAVFAARGAVMAWRDRNQPGRPQLLLPLAVGAPFLAYLLLHSLHDRVQGHWPVPLFSAAALLAAVAAEPDPERRAAGGWRLAAPIVGLGLAALLMLHMALPRSGYATVFDPTLAIRGWPRFAVQVEQLRRAQGAEWVGTESYGLLAQLDIEGAVKAPMMEILERERYGPDAPRPDLARPGLVIDLDRRVNRHDLLRCFAVVEPAGDLDRGPNRGPAVRYTAFRVSQPLRDVRAIGCPG